MTWFSPWLAEHVAGLSLWISAICTLGLYSILYRENKFYRFIEHIYVGLAMGYLLGTVWNDMLLPKWWQPFWDEGKWWMIFYTIVGLFYYFIFSKKFAWLSRLAIGFFLGVASGRAFQAFVNDVWPQIPTSFKPIIPHGEYTNAAGETVRALNVPDAINNFLFMAILLCVMSYFFFSFEQRNPILKGSAKWGRWLMMFTFGAIFGSTMMARLALLIDRVDFLLNDFGPAIGGPFVMFLILMGLAALVVYLVTRPGAKAENEPG
jgi:hypothetical protein